MSLLRLIYGRRLANEEYVERKISAFEGLPAMGLDGLSSSSYGPEAALTILMPAGAAGLAYIGVVMAPFLILLALLYFSYRQTIRAYPNNGGAYTVAKENLGTNAGLLAAAALMIDYVLNVAVGISAGVGALTSAVPSLHPFTLWICLGILVVVAFMNLRGTMDAGRAWAIPAYLFVASLLAIIAIGAAKTVATHGHPLPVVMPPPLPRATAAVSLWLIVRSFAAACTAMTGVEAVSNGVGVFRDPVVVRAHRTLGVICGILGLLLAGVTYLVPAYGIGAMDQTKDGYQSVVSQLAGAVVGHGIFYYVAIATTLWVLCLSASTSFVDFPRVCRLVAGDDFLPRSFAAVGRRLVFSVGIVYLALAAGLLLIVFNGITDRLIALFAIGAFLTFTMSQSGMVVHWYRKAREAGRKSRRGLRVSLIINAIGATATAVALVIIVVAKFTEGAWVTLIAIPCTIAALKQVHRYYRKLDSRLRAHGPIALQHTEPPIMLIVSQEWDRPTARALQFALRLSPDVVAVHLTDLGGPDVHEQRRALRRRWAEQVGRPVTRLGLHPPRLVLLEAPYRRIEGPVLELIEEIAREHPKRLIAVLIPTVVKEHWWQYVLHGTRARRLRSALMRYGGSHLLVINVPWYLEEPRIEEGLEQEEKQKPAGPGRPASRRTRQH